MDIHIQQGWDLSASPQVATLYEEAFGPKFMRAIPDKQTRIDILSCSFKPAFSFVALSQGEIVGLAGFQQTSGSLTGGLGASVLLKKLGILKGLWACLVLSLFEREADDKELVMDGIVVDPTVRGKGVGSQLLDAIIHYATEQGYDTVRLDVIDSNPRARKLYEAKGFKAVETNHIPYLKWLVGFSAATTMTLRL
ncbi:GNAT family N-acetyltransferase [Aestuariibacter halophilus]|uniref:GNAT family N-acetyltransferase n=1 Tax=Fluctibacter halophilus TaxID=226011 RepID=A0ABS8G9P4_9ALTE|nr:GNAT family N-acetyltransferase [Aestuariibacter halophilus]MCC2617133.1 GNAT family N-acetyltransferase [Aestuariibacter halophilus]